MILRLFRGRVTAADRDRYLLFVRENAVARALALPGLLSFQPGMRPAGDGIDVVLVSTWDDFASIASLDRNLDLPLSLPGGAEFIRDGASTHYELVAGSLRSMPLDGARLRVLHGMLSPNREAAFFEWTRDQRDRLFDDGLLLGAHLGRRMLGTGAEAVFVGIWRDEEAIDALTGGEHDRPVALGEETLDFFEEPPAIEEYEALTLAPRAATAPALLLADDDHRYLYATPAAARLAGRSVAALTSLRVEDLVPPDLAESVSSMWSTLMATGSGDGPFVLLAPDGSRREIRYRARANTPWPGSHTWLLAEIGTGGETDLDEALADAGIVARHTPVAATAT